jgi:hypothetical protein
MIEGERRSVIRRGFHHMHKSSLGFDARQATHFSSTTQMFL